VGKGDFVSLGCDEEALRALSHELKTFGAADGALDWLVSAVWLSTRDTDYVATSSTQVLSDGYIARVLDISSVVEFVERLKAGLPDISERLRARREDIQLPPADEQPARPQLLRDWPGAPYDTFVIVRVAERATNVHEVSCALLFANHEGGKLLVGTDPSTAAMVISEDEGLIARYCEDCDVVPAADYARRSAC